MLSVEELFELEDNIREELDDHLTAALASLNRSGQLEELLQLLGIQLNNLRRRFPLLILVTKNTLVTIRTMPHTRLQTTMYCKENVSTRPISQKCSALLLADCMNWTVALLKKWPETI